VPEHPQCAMVQRHPVILAFIARHLIDGTIEGARQGCRTVRTEFSEQVPRHALDVALGAYRAEGHRLAATERAV
jgi:hypothetical protein